VRCLVIEQGLELQKTSRIGSGNRCGHDPHNPLFRNWVGPHAGKKIPIAIQNIAAGVDGYYSNPRAMPALCYSKTRKKTKCGKARQNRSELREAEVLLMKAVYFRADWASLRVGTPLPNGKFKPLSHLQLAKIMEGERLELSGESGNDDPAARFTRFSGKAGKLRPSTRYWAAFKSLSLAGAWDTHKRYHTMEDGTKRAKTSIKVLNIDFIVALTGVPYHAIKALRDYSSSSTKAKRTQFTKDHPGHKDQELAQMKLWTKLLHSAGRSQAKAVKQAVKPTPPKTNEKPQDAITKEKHKEINAYMAALAGDGLDRNEVLRLVKVKYPEYGYG